MERHSRAHSSVSDGDLQDSASLSDSTEATASCSSSSSRQTASRGKRKRSCKWSADWKRYHMTPSASYVCCTLCQTDISIASGGIHDVRRHTEGKKHREYARSVASQVPIRAALQSSSAAASVDRQVTVAEVYFLCCGA